MPHERRQHLYEQIFFFIFYLFIDMIGFKIYDICSLIIDFYY